MTPGPSVRQCAWLNGTHGTVVAVTPAAWWLAISRDPKTTRYRTARSSGRRFICGSKKGSIR